MNFEGVIMNNMNQKMIDAVIEKAERVCPGSLALIGVYGSVATGDEYAKAPFLLKCGINTASKDYNMIVE